MGFKVSLRIAGLVCHTRPMPQPDLRDSSVRVYTPEPVADVADVAPEKRLPEFGGRKDGTEPTRYGDWEKQGRCIDF